jgi:hypothetical protein
VKKTVKDVILEVAEVHNLRLKVQRMANTMTELAKYGPMRPEETRGLSEETGKVSELNIHAYGEPTNLDEYGYRTGCPPPSGVTAIMLKAAEAGQAAVHYKLVEEKKALDLPTLKGHLARMKAAVMIAYPAYHRLPWYDPCRQECEDVFEMDGRSDTQDYLDGPPDTSMWWAGKSLVYEKLLSDYVGTNEKSKLICRFDEKEKGAPVRQPRLDKETHKQVTEQYWERQKIERQLAADTDESYKSSPWANPNALKQALSGGRDIKFAMPGSSKPPTLGGTGKGAPAPAVGGGYPPTGL